MAGKLARFDVVSKSPDGKDSRNLSVSAVDKNEARTAAQNYNIAVAAGDDQAYEVVSVTKA